MSPHSWSKNPSCEERPKRQRPKWIRCCTAGNGGGMGIRTPGLLIANETLYQLSYTPGNPACAGHVKLASNGCSAQEKFFRLSATEQKWNF